MSTLEARLAARRPTIRWWNPIGSKLDQIAFDRALNGARELERLRPGSVAALDTAKLSISSPENCAVGQTYGSYGAECVPGHLAVRSVEFGFNFSRFIKYARLTRAWKQIVPAYRAAAS